MRFVITIVAILSFLSSYACDCDDLPQLSQKDLDQTDYIALVRIKEILPLKEGYPKYRDRKDYFRIVVEVLTLYKGHPVSEIIVGGGNELLKTYTSCGLGMNEGQEWVIFAPYDQGTPVVEPCGRSVLYRQDNGLRDWQFQRGFKELAFLNNAYHKVQEPLQQIEGTVTTLFPNGRVEKREEYQNGKLNGTNEYYFPNGQLFGKSNYRNGQLQGKSFWYYLDGAVKDESTYKKGIKVDTSIYYTKTAKGYKPFFVHVFDDKGNLLRSQDYAGNYQDRYLWTEDIYEPSKKKFTQIVYYQNGNVQSIGLSVRNKLISYTEYDEQGKVTHRYKYDKKGEVIK